MGPNMPDLTSAQRNVVACGIDERAWRRLSSFVLSEAAKAVGIDVSAAATKTDLSRSDEAAHRACRLSRSSEREWHKAYKGSV